MEPNKIEQEFKSKLEGRTIQPSAQAWDRLDAMLTVAEEKKPRKKRTWLFIAASFIVFLTIGIFLLQQGKNTNDGITIKDAVVTTATEPNIENETLQPVEIAEPKVGVELTATDKVIKQQKSIAVTAQPAPKVKKTLIHNTTQNNAQIIEEVESPITEYKREEVAVTSNTNTEKTTIKKAKRGITVNPDELLASVEERDVNVGNITTPRSNDSKIKVNSNSLLSSAEREVNESFRSKVLQTAVKNYNAIKTSVANRNYQQNQ